MSDGEAKTKGTPVLCALEERDIPDLRASLARYLSKPQDIPSLLPECLRWKYFQPRADYVSPRSWAYRDDAGQIIAHLGIGPITFLLRDATVTANMMIDWAASPDWRGVGLRLMDEVTKDLPLHFALGGTPAAQRSLKKQQYGTVGTLEDFPQDPSSVAGISCRAPALQAMAPVRMVCRVAFPPRVQEFGRRLVRRADPVLPFAPSCAAQP